MKFSIPSKFPTLKDFVSEIQYISFPDLGEDVGINKYADANENAARELGFYDESISQDSDYLRLIYTVSKYCPVFNKENKYVLENSVLSLEGLNSFCDSNNKSLRNWMTDTKNSKTTKTVDSAVFYTLLLLKRKECSGNIEQFFKKCLDYIGITDLDVAECITLFNFDWNEIDKTKPGFENKPFAWLSNKAIECFALTVFTIFSLVGQDEKLIEEKLTLVHNIFKDLLKNEIKVSASMSAAEKALWNSIKYFIPRSIQTSNQEMYPQDFFVMPVFEKKGIPESPFAAIKGADYSTRSMLVAKTGMGKSLFLQMSAICMLNSKYGEENASIDKLSRYIEVPDDVYLIYVPAKMFSYCYANDLYRGWTENFIRLYFNCMWKLSSSLNFYSTNNSQRFGGINVSEYALGNEDFAVLEKVVREYACNGKLLLILDSFDEIAAGDMRNDYLKAVSSFYKDYCEYPECVGAHVILASREMSHNTMMSVSSCLDLQSDDGMLDAYRIKELNPDQRATLISKWDKFKKLDSSETENKINSIESNHCLREFAVNPYMLSVVCFYFDKSLGDISGRYIDFLVNNMLGKNRNECDEIQDVLSKIPDTLQDIACSTITNGISYFSKGSLTKYIKAALDKIDINSDIPAAEKERMIEKIHEIIVVSVGLIVPADGKDDAYQFINDQIRYEFAAKKIRSTLQEQNCSASYYVNGILPAISSIKDYAGVLVPMICAIDLEDPQLSQVLVLDLLMRKVGTDNPAKDEELLICAMVDLLLNRYGSNITTSGNPGQTVEASVRQTQRMLLMRLFTSPAFNPTADEKEKIKESVALTKNISYFSERILNSLN